MLRLPIARNLLRVRRGFTLVEMMIVVAVIGICAALATPSITRLQEQSRTQKDALSVLTLLQDAAARARGRGAAVQLRMTGNYIVMTESLQDVNGDGTVDLPVSACNGTPSPTLKFFTSKAKEGQNVMTLTAGAADTTVFSGADRWICFTPRGRTFVSADGATWTRQADVLTFTFTNDTSSAVRQVDLFPGGSSRLHI